MTKRIKICTVVCILLTIFSITFIFSNSLKSGEESYEQSKGLVAFVESILDPHDKIPTEKFNYAVRKTAHFLEFALLGFSVGGTVALVCLVKGKSDISTPLLCGLFVAVIDEFIQSFSGRSSRVSDILIDFCGVVFGVLLAKLIISAKTRKANSAQREK